MLRKRLLLVPVLFMLVAGLLLGACQPAAPAAEEPVPAQEEAKPDEATPVEEVAAPTEEPAPAEEPAETGPQVGGTMVIVTPGDATTLDIQKVAGWGTLFNLLHPTLVAIDPNNQFAPYLAESYTVSEDGLIYEFKLRPDIKFSNGDPVTANDFVYSIQRAMDPATASPASSVMWGPVASYEAVDDFTLRLTLAQANYSFLLGLSFAPATPVSQRAIEELGDDYDFNPVGCGPYILADYITAEKFILERNPDYVWGPSWTHGGPAYIQTLEFRIIPEYATQIAGLEAGEIDMLDWGAEIAYTDVSRIREDGRFNILEVPDQGMWPFVEFNVSKPPFDDIRLRKAFNLAINRDSLVAVILQGNGTPLYGPITAGTLGYDPIVEEFGYHYDLDQAKALMEEAGYTYDANGMLITPEGEPFVLEFPVANGQNRPQIAQVLAEQYKALGVTLNLTLEDWGINWTRQIEGNYDITISGLGYNDAEIMYIGLHSSMLGAVNAAQVNDPVLDEILERTRSETEPAARQAAVTEAQKYIIEQAYIAPMFTAVKYYATNKRIQDLLFISAGQTIWFEDAYIVEE